MPSTHELLNRPAHMLALQHDPPRRCDPPAPRPRCQQTPHNATHQTADRHPAYSDVTRKTGLAVDGETIPYVAGWGEEGALDAVAQFAQIIDQYARRLETALQVPHPVEVASAKPETAAA